MTCTHAYPICPTCHKSKLRRHKASDRIPGKEASSPATSLETSPTNPPLIRPLILLIPLSPMWTPRSVGWKHLMETSVSSRIGYVPTVAIYTLTRPSPRLPTHISTKSCHPTPPPLNQQDRPRSNRAETTHHRDMSPPTHVVDCGSAHNTEVVSTPRLMIHTNLICITHSKVIIIQ